MRIYVGGSLRNVPREPDRCRDYVGALTTCILRQGHVLLNGCRSSLDLEAARVASRYFEGHGGDGIEQQLVSYRLGSDEPIHTLGDVKKSALTDWNLNHPRLVVPEQIERCDVAIFTAGSTGTNWAKNWAEIAKKPIIGVPRFGGAAEEIYYFELNRHLERDDGLADHYERLNSESSEVDELAAETVRLATRLTMPTIVFTIMSFEDEYVDVFDSYASVCQGFELTAERTDQSPDLSRIVERIESGIRRSLFVIADISESSENVFYELGYAKGHGKQVIVTAREGTTLPFDVTDIPVIFWSTQRELREELRRAVGNLRPIPTGDTLLEARNREF